MEDDGGPEKDEEKNYIADESSSDDSFNLDLELKCETCNKTFSSVKSLLQHEKSGKHHKKLARKKLERKVNRDLEDELGEEFGDLMLSPKPYAVCDTCKKNFSGPESFHQHLKSKVHHKKVAKAKLLEQVTEDGIINVEKFKEICKPKGAHQEELVGASGYSPSFEETELDDNVIAQSHQFECAECDKVFTGVDPWHQHLISKTHEKTLRQKKLLEKVTSGVFSKRPAEPVDASSPVADMDAIEVDGDVLMCQLCHKSFSGPESAAAHIKSKGHAKKREFKQWRLEHSAKAVATQKRKAQDFRSESQTSAQATEAGFEENKSSSSSEIVNEPSLGKDPGDRSQNDDSQFCEESGGDSKIPDSASSDGAVETGSAPNDEKENVLLCYESYKNYKKIMNKIEAEKTD